jgi:S1-C subfamily serine protease
MHEHYETIKPTLAGKQAKSSPYKTPREYPSLAGKYQAKIDYQGRVARSCIHCHQIREAERLVYRSAGKPIPHRVLFPYPDPYVLGLMMDPKKMATVKQVDPGSIAERAGLKVGDEIVKLADQPLLSIADLQWVLHNAPPTGKLAADVRRGGQPLELMLDLPRGWRRGNLSWRATTWDLRRMGLGGMQLQELTDQERAALGLKKDAMALLIRHLGEYGEHAVAKRAGLEKGDILVAFDGRSGRMTETDLIAYTTQQKRPDDEVDVTVLRKGERKNLRYALQ